MTREFRDANGFLCSEDVEEEAAHPPVDMMLMSVVALDTVFSNKVPLIHTSILLRLTLKSLLLHLRKSSQLLLQLP